MTVQRLFTFLILFTAIACKKDEYPPIKFNAPTEIPLCGESKGGVGLDYGYHATVLNNHIYVIGSTQSEGNGASDVWLLKCSEEAQVVSSWTYGGAGKDQGYFIHSNSTGNLMLVGSSEEGPGGQGDLMVSELTSDGVVKWQNYYGGAGYDVGYSLKEIPNGYAVLGTSSSRVGYARDVYFLLLDKGGNLLREQVFGGVSNDGGADLEVLPNGDLMLFCYTNDSSGVNQDYWLIRCTSNGDSLWSKTYGGPGYEEAQDIELSSDGNLLLCGHSTKQDPEHQIWALKLDLNGGILNENHFGGSRHDGGQALLTKSDGLAVLVGRSNSHSTSEERILLEFTDGEGNLLEEKILGCSENDRADHIVEMNDKIYLIGEKTANGNRDLNIVIVD